MCYLPIFNCVIIFFIDRLLLDTKQSEILKDQIITSFVESKVNKTPTISDIQKFRPSPVKDTQSHANQAIQRWKEKIIDQSHSPLSN